MYPLTGMFFSLIMVISKELNFFIAQPDDFSWNSLLDANMYNYKLSTAIYSSPVIFSFWDTDFWEVPKCIIFLAVTPSIIIIIIYCLDFLTLQVLKLLNYCASHNW